jgi:hypothetical protein
MQVKRSMLNEYFSSSPYKYPLHNTNGIPDTVIRSIGGLKTFIFQATSLHLVFQNYSGARIYHYT